MLFEVTQSHFKPEVRCSNWSGNQNASIGLKADRPKFYTSPYFDWKAKMPSGFVDIFITAKPTR